GRVVVRRQVRRVAALYAAACGPKATRRSIAGGAACCGWIAFRHGVRPSATMGHSTRSKRMRRHAVEVHRSGRSGWLRAAVLGANDGIVSTAGLVVGVASAGAGAGAVLIAGVAGVVAGAMS